MIQTPLRSSHAWRLYSWLGIFTAVFVWSAIHPTDRFTWVLEVCPAVIALIILGATRQRFPLTTLAYTLILIHAIILMVGGKYTYAQVPLFDWISTLLGQSRNHYDKLGHLAQGFIPAIIARELLIRYQVRWIQFRSATPGSLFSTSTGVR